MKLGTQRMHELGSETIFKKALSQTLSHKFLSSSICLRLSNADSYEQVNHLCTRSPQILNLETFYRSDTTRNSYNLKLETSARVEIAA